MYYAIEIAQAKHGKRYLIKAVYADKGGVTIYPFDRRIYKSMADAERAAQAAGLTISKRGTIYEI